LGSTVRLANKEASLWNTHTIFGQGDGWDFAWSVGRDLLFEISWRVGTTLTMTSTAQMEGDRCESSEVQGFELFGGPSSGVAGHHKIKEAHSPHPPPKPKGFPGREKPVQLIVLLAFPS